MATQTTYPETVYEIPSSWGNTPKGYATERVIDECREQLAEVFGQDPEDEPREWTYDRVEDGEAVYVSRATRDGRIHRDELRLTMDEIDDEVQE